MDEVVVVAVTADTVDVVCKKNGELGEEEMVVEENQACIPLAKYARWNSDANFPPLGTRVPARDRVRVACASSFFVVFLPFSSQTPSPRRGILSDNRNPIACVALGGLNFSHFNIRRIIAMIRSSYRCICQSFQVDLFV